MFAEKKTFEMKSIYFPDRIIIVVHVSCIRHFNMMTS